MLDITFNKDSVRPIILTGGSGSRLWPLSREAYPKQFLELLGENSLFQETVKRLSYPIFSKPHLLTNYQHRFIVAEQIGRLGVKPASIVLEPVSRNTAPAILTAALLTAEQDEQQVLLFLPSDQFIGDNLAFYTAVEKGIEITRHERIVIFGVQPTSPHTGYGYIKTGDMIADGVCQVSSFAEKPSEDKAESYITEGGYLWNAGMFMATAKTLISAFEKFRPEMVEHCRQALKNSKRDLDFNLLDEESFVKNENISIDYAVIEKHPDLACVALETYWSDLGTWTSVADSVAKDKDGNHGHGSVIFEDSNNCFVHSSDKAMVAVLGLDNIVAVATKDAVLVTSKDRAEDVKQIVEKLKADNQRTALYHRRVYRPWGWFEGLEEDSRFQVKCLHVKPGGVLSLQSHHHRAEHWVVVSGTAKVTINETTKLLTENESVYVPLGAIHRLENHGKIPVKLIEVQTGSYLGEDDIVRYEDVYKRPTEDAKKVH